MTRGGGLHSREDPNTGRGRSARHRADTRLDGADDVADPLRGGQLGRRVRPGADGVLPTDLAYTAAIPVENPTAAVS